MTIGDKIYTNDEVQSIDLNGGIQDVFSIGNTPSVCLDLVLRNTSDIIYNTTPINVEIGLNINNKIEYIPLGIFNIDKVKKDDFTIKITAYDNMSKFKVPYFSSLGNTATLTQVANEVAAKTGVQFEGTLPAYTVKKLEGFSCREVLGFIASLCGGNAIIKRNGKFTIVYPTDINRDIGEGVFDFTREEVKYKIGKITCKVEDKTLSKGSLGADSMEIQFENPWMNEAILTGIYKKLNGFEYLGYTLKWQGDPSLDIGDIITYKDDRGVIRKLPIFNRKLSYDGGLDSELFAKGETKNKNSFDSSGSMKKKVDRVVTELAIVNEALVDVAYIGDLTAGNIKFDTASGTIMDLQTLLTKHVTGENGQFLNLTTDNVTISNALLKDVIAANISVQDLKAGNIDANRFNIVGSNGNLVIKDNTIQIKDSTRVRVQIGKDANGDYSMYVWDKQGNIMFDALGLKSSAIKDKIIRDDMISDNANINGSKLNISSLIAEVNKDNTQTLKASKIAFDSTGQSLEVSFNSLKTNVDNIQIGGRNYIKDYKFKNEDIWKKSRKESQIDTAQGYGYLSGTTQNPFLYQDLEAGLIKKGDTLTLQYEVKFDGVSGGTGTNSFLIRTALTGYLNNNSMVQDIGIFGKHESDGLYLNQGWQKVVKTITITSNAVFDYARFRLYARNFNGTIYFRNVKLEKGSKATDLSPALEDIDSKIEANTTSISAIQGKIGTLIKDTTIEKDGQTVKLKDAYSRLDQTVSSINKTVGEHSTTMDGLETRVKSAEEKLEPDKIVSTVKDHRTNGVNTFALNSEVKQTTDAWVAKFSSKGGYNLIKNGDVTRHRLNFWWLENGANIWHVGDSWIGIYKHADTEGFLVSETIKVEPGKTYSFSCQVEAEGATLGADVYFIGSTNNDRYYGWTPKLGGAGAGERNTVEYTFTVPSNINYGFIRLDTNGSTNYSGGFVCWFKHMVLIEGSVPAKTFIPYKNEIYEGSTMIDANGVTIFNGALTVKNSSGTTMLQGDTSGTFYVKDGGIVVAGTATDVWNNRGYRTTLRKQGLDFNFDSDGGGYPPFHGSIYLDYSLENPGVVLNGIKSISSGGKGSVGVSGSLSVSSRLGVGGDVVADGSISTLGKVILNGGGLAPASLGNGGKWGSMVIDGVNNGWAGFNFNQVNSSGMYQLVNNDTFGCHDVNWLWRNERATFKADGRHNGWVGGYEAYRDGGHFRIAPSDNDGAARWEAFNRYGSIVGSFVFDGTYLRPNSSNGYILGYSSARWQDVYCTRGAFNGSDSKLKENIKAISRTEIGKLSNDNEPTSIDLYNYIKDTGVYTFNYKNTTNNMLGVLADEIPDNVFNKIGIMTKTEEEYQKELQEQEEAKKVLESTPIPLIDEEYVKLENTIVEGTELTYKELKEKAEKTIEEPIRMINSASQIAMLQEVLSMALNKIDILEQRIEELEKLLAS